ncbi:HMG box-containing protein 1-like isoform X2 [Centruroides vittatus]|uniref:HMG box-containing protein 1-like isoform X2 n=1 Tax=Centruroides sculpturatus TaxID=218467 RepID=UPI000C6CDC81|nr:HMG box-containing protein 1-like isoform X2 [Centruroides sculpturatus]
MKIASIASTVWQQPMTTFSVCHELTPMFEKSEINEEPLETIESVIVTVPSNEVQNDKFKNSDTLETFNNESEVGFIQRKTKTVPPPLKLDGPIDANLVPDPVYDRLTELAIIATSPQSPLLQNSPSLPRKRSFSLSSLHSYARPPKATTDVSEVKSTIKQRNTYHFEEHIYQKYNQTDLTPEDTSAAYTLSTMAQKFTELKSYIYPAKHKNKAKDNLTELVKPKRPMNGFMLFARKFRVLYSQKYPGKDNRAISVLLGDHWKKLKSEERDAYAYEAKVMAEKTKKLHPDCWKRKRSFSTSS